MNKLRDYLLALFELCGDPRTIILLVALLWLAGCAHFDVVEDKPVEGWPALTTRIFLASYETIARECKGADEAPQANGIGACAQFDFNEGYCTIWALDLNDRALMREELAHCEGRQHPGSTAMKEALARWKNR